MAFRINSTRSPVKAGFAGWAVFSIGIPLTLWAWDRFFPDPGIPVFPTSVWVDFAVMMLAVGALAGGITYGIVRLRPGWPRSFLCALWIALIHGADIDDFARMPLSMFLERWFVVSVAVALVFGSMLHAVIPNQPRLERGPVRDGAGSRVGV